MIEKIKEKIWELLKEKQVSLAMIFNDQGRILWHRGRDVASAGGLSRGGGYCSTAALAALRNRSKIIDADQTAAVTDLQGSESARNLRIRSVFVLPLASGYFLYLDSGTREGFSPQERAVFEAMGSLLSGVIRDAPAGGPGGKKVSGAGKAAAELRERLVQYAIEEEPVLILGETGVGKSLIAELIHFHSGRRGAFVTVNTPGIPETLLESQVFGHVRGAFSGAVSDARGFVAEAEAGTLFFDEVGDISPSVQAKLLRFIETRSFHRVGDPRERTADVRILAATNHDLPGNVRERTFREDLFFRLNCLSLKIPPLRERIEDLDSLLEENRGLLRGKNLTAGAWGVLRKYDWPGNIREFLQVLKTAAIRFKGAEIGSEIEDLLVFSGVKDGDENDRLEAIWKQMEQGGSFWEAVKQPFLRRELNRTQVQSLLERGLKQCGGRYVDLLKLFNLPASDYKSFMGFLYDQRLR